MGIAETKNAAATWEGAAARLRSAHPEHGFGGGWGPDRSYRYPRSAHILPQLSPRNWLKVEAPGFALPRASRPAWFLSPGLSALVRRPWCVGPGSSAPVRRHCRLHERSGAPVARHCLSLQRKAGKERQSLPRWERYHDGWTAACGSAESVCCMTRTRRSSRPASSVVRSRSRKTCALISSRTASPIMSSRASAACPQAS